MQAGGYRNQFLSTKNKSVHSVLWVMCPIYSRVKKREEKMIQWLAKPPLEAIILNHFLYDLINLSDCCGRILVYCFVLFFFLQLCLKFIDMYCGHSFTVLLRSRRSTSAQLKSGI